MDQYKEVIKQIEESDLEYSFKQARSEDIQYLNSLKLTPGLIEFYKSFEPIDHNDMGPVRFLDIESIKEENTEYIPGYQISPKGFIVFATTGCGNAICFNLNKTKNGEPTIAHISHEENYEDWSLEKIVDEDYNETICESFYEFLCYFRDYNIKKLDMEIV